MKRNFPVYRMKNSFFFPCIAVAIDLCIFFFVWKGCKMRAGGSFLFYFCIPLWLLFSLLPVHCKDVLLVSPFFS